MTVDEIYLLPCGFLDLDQSILTAGIGSGRTVSCPVYSVLVLTENSWVLLDTGLNPDGLDDPVSAWGGRSRVVRPTMTREDDIRNRLGALGVDTEDVAMVINTHLHWDHTGGNRFFPGRPIFVQRKEHDFAFEQARDPESPYMGNHFAHPVDYELLDGDLEVARGVSVVSTPGHTPGHQSVVLDLPGGGTVIVAGDAVYTERNLEGRIPPGHCWDKSDAVESMDRLSRIREASRGTLLPGHEPGFWSLYEPGRMP